MEADVQTWLNFAFSLIFAGVGWFLRSIWTAIRDLQSADSIMADKVSRIEILVAGKYVTRDEHMATSQRILDKLDQIEQRLANKADR